jgi:CRISPR-associated exonuclease Cas4
MGYLIMEHLAISALQHLLYCPRQCALIHVEQQWVENKFTAEGRVMHEKAHEGADESREGIRITRGMPVGSMALGLYGVCDVVEFHRNGNVLPVEYKRGKPKLHRADEVQLCAQGMCLEEMLGISIPRGALFYGTPRRRTDVVFDAALRRLVEETSRDFHAMMHAGITPPAEYEKPKCEGCSLMEVCQPQLGKRGMKAADWFMHALQNDS